MKKTSARPLTRMRPASLGCCTADRIYRCFRPSHAGRNPTWRGCRPVVSPPSNTCGKNTTLDVPDDLTTLLKDIADAAPDRAAGANLPPFGLVHGELHPTSIHIGARGPYLLDLAKAFIGPGLLDLATWHGTRHPPDAKRMHAQILRYVASGGYPDALTARGGIPAAEWALGWHRLWAANWLLDQAACGRNPLAPSALFAAVRRQLITARELFDT